ncbi:MAG: Ig-like domain-containing protein, partial [Firmicutes bacterium]|nr:Ig-like domain-containing protein [Bacillota bacterium]
SVSAVVNQTVDFAGTSVALASAPNASVFGQSATFTALVTVTGLGSGIPTGTVEFYNGAVKLGEGTLDVFGKATFATSALPVGEYEHMTARYLGDGSFAASTSADYKHEVVKAATSVTLSSNANPSAVGQSVTFTASVSVTGLGAGAPTGTVTFKNGAATLGTGTLNASGVATFATSDLPLGTHNITAEYSGDGSFGISTSAVHAQVVAASSTTTNTVMSAPNPSVFGQSVTFTAFVTVNAPGTGAPAGTVEFRINGGMIVGTGTLNASGEATYTTSSLPVGSHPVAAVYLGSSEFGGSNSAVFGNYVHVVNKADVETSVTSNKTSTVYGEALTLTATVTAVAPGAGTPTGYVAFFSGSTLLGEVWLMSGAATLTVSGLNVAAHNITVAYRGDRNFNESSQISPLSVKVDKADTEVLLSSGADAIIYGQAAVLSATVKAKAPGAGVPQGVVELWGDDKKIGESTLNVAGEAMFIVFSDAIPLLEGEHSFKAVYKGSTNFNGSASAGLSVECLLPRELSEYLDELPDIMDELGLLKGGLKKEHFTNGSWNTFGKSYQEALDELNRYLKETPSVEIEHSKLRALVDKLRGSFEELVLQPQNKLDPEGYDPAGYKEYEAAWNAVQDYIDKAMANGHFNPDRYQGDEYQQLLNGLTPPGPPPTGCEAPWWLWLLIGILLGTLTAIFVYAAGKKKGKSARGGK